MLTNLQGHVPFYLDFLSDNLLALQRYQKYQDTVVLYTSVPFIEALDNLTCYTRVATK